MFFHYNNIGNNSAKANYPFDDIANMDSNQTSSLRTLSVASAEDIANTLNLSSFQIVDYISKINNNMELSDYLSYAIKFRDDIIFCGLFRNPLLDDEHLGRLNSYYSLGTIINCLVASSKYATQDVLLKTLDSRDTIVKLAAAFRTQISDSVLISILKNADSRVKDILVAHPNLTDSQKVTVALCK